MSEECVVGVYASFEKAQAALRALEDADYPASQVSFVTHRGEEPVPREESITYGDKTENNAAKGAGVGGLIGMLLGAPILTIGGLGAILIAGPIAAGLTGAIVGGFLGAMSGWGVHNDHVKTYEKKVAEGKLLVVATGDPQQVVEADRILRATDAEEVHLHAETSADTVEP